MRVAISGSHGTGKSTLIASFLAERPSFEHEPEAYEALADEVELTETEGPTREGLEGLLRHSIETVARYRPDDSVVFERSPVDYLAYAAASRRSWPRGDIAAFLSAHAPEVRDALRHLDLVVLLPLEVGARTGENPAFRRRVDAALRAALVDDEYDLFGGPESAHVVELDSSPRRQLSRLLELTRVAAA